MRRLFPILICSLALDVSADCFVESGLDYMDDHKSVGVVVCQGADTESRQNVATAIARAKLAELTSANFEHTLKINGSLQKVEQFTAGFVGAARIIATDNAGDGVRYTVEALLDQELRDRMAEGMARFPALTHRLALLESRIKQLLGEQMGSSDSERLASDLYKFTGEMELIRGAVLSADEVAKRVMEYEIIESGTIEYLKALTEHLEVTILTNDLSFNSRLDRWELQQQISWQLMLDIDKPPWIEVVWVARPGGEAHIRAKGAKHIKEVFAQVIETHTIELQWAPNKRAWALTYPCMPYYAHEVEWGITSCSKSTHGAMMAITLRRLDARAVERADQFARVTAPLNSPDEAQDFGRIRAVLTKIGG